MVASLMVLADGRIDDASPDALTLLGTTISQLRSLPPGAFSPDPPNPEEDAAFREAWEASGRQDIAGVASMRLLDGNQIRVRFSITVADDDRFLVILERIPGQVSEPPRLYTGREVIAEWRAAERRLETLDPDSDEAQAVKGEIEHLRDLYQQVARAR